jgi:hypothetical protein
MMTDTTELDDTLDAPAAPATDAINLPQQVEASQPKAQVLPGPVRALAPKSFEEYARVAAAVYHSGVIPASYEGKTPEETRGKLMVGMMKGAEVGLGPMGAIDWIMIVNNRTTVWGDGAMMLAERSGFVEDKQEMFMYEPPEGLPRDLNQWPDEYCCTYQMRRVGRATPIVHTFSVGMARRANLWNNPKKKPWIQHPQRMLSMRARSWCLRDGFSDCLGGLHIREEVEDMHEIEPHEVDKRRLFGLAQEVAPELAPIEDAGTTEGVDLDRGGVGDDDDGIPQPGEADGSEGSGISDLGEEPGLHEVRGSGSGSGSGAYEGGSTGGDGPKAE